MTPTRCLLIAALAAWLGPWLVLVAEAQVAAELWVSRYNGPANSAELGYSVAVDSAGNVAVTGHSFNGSNYDYYTAKYAAANGALIWEKRYNGPANSTDLSHSVAVDGAGNVIVTGQSFNASNSDYYTVKYAAADGALMWEKRYNGPANNADVAYALAVDSAGNVAVTGSSSNGSNSDYYTAKYAAADGALLWEKRYNGTGNSGDNGWAVAVDGAGNVIVTGQSFGSGTFIDYYTAKYAAADGALLWEKRYNGPNNSSEIAYSVAVDSSGNVAVTGWSSNILNNDYYTAKYAAADGALIWEKRYNGPAGDMDEGHSVAMDSAGNVAVTGRSLGSVGGNADFYTAKYAAADGTLLWEKRFGPAGDDEAFTVAMDSAGNVAVTGTSSNDYYTAKYAAADGALLWEKRYNGPANAGEGMNAFPYAGRIALTADGGAVVTGQSSNGSNSDLTTVRYIPGPGARDSSFSGDGAQSTNFAGDGANNGERANAVAVQPDGKVVVAGTVGHIFGSSNPLDFAVARCLADGGLDPSFGTGGRVLIDFTGGQDACYGVALQSDGKIVLAGTSHNGTKYTAAVVRLNPDGQLDPTFGTGGRATFMIEDRNVDIYAVALQSDGRIVVAGTAERNDDWDMVVARFTSAGVPDMTFDGDGFATMHFGQYDGWYGMAIQSDGKIVVAGNTMSVGGGDFVVARYHVNGGLDASFGSGGRVTTAIGSGDDTALGVAIQRDGKIVAAGYSMNGGTHDLSLVRYLSNGSLDSTFDGDGKVLTAAANNEYAESVALQSDGKIVVAGWGDSNGLNQDSRSLVARYNPDGTLDATFDGDGKISLSVGSLLDSFHDGVIAPDGKIVAVGQLALPNNGLFSMVRLIGGPNELLVNGGFEAIEALGNGAATGYGDWAQDQATTVAAENGITPYQGTRMAKILATGPTGPTGPGGSPNAELTQFVDLSRFAADVALGGLSVTVTARVNRVAGAGVDTEFGLTLQARNGNPVSGATLGTNSVTLISDASTATWETMTRTLNIPAGTTHLLVTVSAVENVTNDTASAEFGGHYVDGVTLTVAGAHPVASFVVSPNPAEPAQALAFNGSGSFQPDPARTLVSYAWEFGDAATASGVTTTHTYNLFGSYAAKLTVTDDLGQTAMTTVGVNVNSPPAAHPGGPYVDGLGLYYVAVVGEPLTLDGSNSTDPDAMYGDTLTNYAWDLLDNGTYDTSSSNPQVTVTWATLNTLGITAPGTYPLRLRVTDSFGSSGTALGRVTARTPEEHWRFTYFGTTANTGNAADTADPDGDGNDNLSEFVSGSVPNDGTSRFQVRVEDVPGQPGQKKVIFSPRLADRSYVVKYKLSLTGPAWTVLPNITTSDNGAERTVIDLDAATDPARFYRVEITKQ